MRRNLYSSVSFPFHICLSFSLKFQWSDFMIQIRYVYWVQYFSTLKDHLYRYDSLFSFLLSLPPSFPSFLPFGGMEYLGFCAC
jgi:hypothetical protein